MQRVRDSDGGRLAIGGRFGKYRPEQEISSQKAEVRGDEVIEKFGTAWEAFGINYRKKGPCPMHYYNEALRLTGDIRVSPDDIEKLSIALAGFQDDPYFSEKAGYLLSAMINSGEEKDYILHLIPFEEIHSIGLLNCKNIRVRGDVGGHMGWGMNSGIIIIEGNVGGYIDNFGNSLGLGMQNGKIIVNGNADWRAGFLMHGGEIVIEGDAGLCLGHLMEGGKITVKGNADRKVGEGMKGGEIHLEGDYESLGEIQGGRIFHKGQLIAGW
jgi:formylmethanofuran dehydrogenase subunit C